jgi:hypothetical protein
MKMMVIKYCLFGNSLSLGSLMLLMVAAAG